jgi:hypothetical protein
MINSLGKKASGAWAARHCLNYRSCAFWQVDAPQDFRSEFFLHGSMFYVKLALSHAGWTGVRKRGVFHENAQR